MRVLVRCTFRLLLQAVQLQLISRFYRTRLVLLLYSLLRARNFLVHFLYKLVQQPVQLSAVSEGFLLLGAYRIVLFLQPRVLDVVLVYDPVTRPCNSEEEFQNVVHSGTRNAGLEGSEGRTEVTLCIAKQGIRTQACQRILANIGVFKIHFPALLFFVRVPSLPHELVEHGSHCIRHPALIPR